MILVDTSVWVDHLRRTETGLVRLLSDGEVLTHVFVIEELACGNLPSRDEFLESMGWLPPAPIAEHDEILDLIANQKLYGTGVGSVDIHIIASAMLANAAIWSRDKVLTRQARRVGVLTV